MARRKPPRRRRARGPQRKHLNEAQRLGHAGPQFIAKYEGSDLPRSYRRWFGVGWECAFKELELLGHPVDPAVVQEVLASERERILARRQKRLQRARQKRPGGDPSDSNADYAYIVGYTSAGFPYGVTWEEWDAAEESDALLDAVDDIARREDIEAESSQYTWWDD